MSEIIIRMNDLRACGMCSRGARQFARRHGLDWGKFLREGISSNELEHIDDAMVKKVIEWKAATT